MKFWIFFIIKIRKKIDKDSQCFFLIYLFVTDARDGEFYLISDLFFISFMFFFFWMLKWLFFALRFCLSWVLTKHEKKTAKIRRRRRGWLGVCKGRLLLTCFKKIRCCGKRKVIEKGQQFSKVFLFNISTRQYSHNIQMFC